MHLAPIAKSEFTKTAARFEIDSFDEWLKAGRKLLDVSGCINWWLGDWLNYGTAREWGHKYTEAAKLLEIDGAVLTQYAYVSARVQFSTRVEKLSWSHHREVCALDTGHQRMWLFKAVANEWSVSDLRQAIRQAQSEGDREVQPREFSPVAWASDFLRWVKLSEPNKWSEEQRHAIAETLKPIVELYRELCETA